MIIIIVIIIIMIITIIMAGWGRGSWPRAGAADRPNIDEVGTSLLISLVVIAQLRPF